MKYSVDVNIELPIDKVIKLFDNPEYLQLWQEGLMSFHLLEGEEGMPGAKSEFLYKMGKRMVIKKETIKEKNLPDIFSAIYEAKGVYNLSVNRFIDNGDQTTKYVTEQEYKCNTFFYKMMELLMPGSFIKETKKSMVSFKQFCENNNNILDEG